MIGVLENQIASSNFFEAKIGDEQVGNTHRQLVSCVPLGGLWIKNVKHKVNGFRACEECSMGLFWRLISTNEHYLCTYKYI